MAASVKLRSVLAASLVLLGLYQATPALAAGTSQPTGITISPPLKQLTFGPGILESKVTVTVANNTRQPFTATVKLVDFKALDQNGGITLGQAGIPLTKYGLANWMSLPGGSSLSLAPGQSTELMVSVQNRTDLTPGGHYGAVVLSSKAPDPKAGKVAFNQSLASLLYLKKLGGDHPQLKLNSVTFDASTSLPTNVTTLFASTGNVYVIPRGYIEVLDPQGHIIEKGIINQNSSIIMQGSSEQLITLMQPIASPQGSGRYTLVLHYRYDGQSDYQTKVISFKRGHWTPPIIGIIITGVVLLALLYVVHRKRHHS